MKKKIVLAVVSTLALSSSLMAKANLEVNPEGMKKLTAMAGEKSPYYRAQKEDFPKDYFLVSQNLPFLVGTALFHPKGDSLKLSKEQLDKLIAMKDTIVPVSAKLAKEVKSLELELAKAIIIDKKAPDTLNGLVEKIAKVKSNMTKAHLSCIHDVQGILSAEQFDTLLKLVAAKNAQKK